MNRHIIGFTLFLVIVKSTFLLYWGFLAPNSFISTQIAPSVSETKSVLKLEEVQSNSSVIIKGVTVDSKRLSVASFLSLKCENEDWFSSPTFAQLSIFDENSQLVWSGTTKLEFYSSCITNADGYTPSQQAGFKMSSSKLAALTQNRNYYARVQILLEEKMRHDHLIYKMSDLQPVLFVVGKC